jgi:thymidine phosphorylase
MIPASIIANKRDGHELTEKEIQFMVFGYAQGEIPDYQMSALAMAIYFRGMVEREVLALTMAMVRSGDTLRRIGNSTRVDKHSTGGLGDKTSLVVGPLLACLGYHVPMISGRGLGITGGTLDKLEAIPGYRTNLTESEIDAQLDRIGCVITGATETIAPADRKLYALRDVTATVPSIPLITASIMSKKIAESLDALVLDVKYGSGSFQQNLQVARNLRDLLQRVGRMAGIKTTAILTDMTQPLGKMVGNACEVIESIEVLQGRGPHSVRLLSIELAARLVLSFSPTSSLEQTRAKLTELLDSGAPMEKFEAMVASQGGKLPAEFSLEKCRSIASPRSGLLTGLDCQKIGYSVIAMGGGRKKKEDVINPRVGVRWECPLGAVVTAGQTVAQVYCDSETAFEEARGLLLDSLRFDSGSTEAIPPLWRE